MFDIKNIFKSLKRLFMITEDKLAAAQIAQIFGSELLKVQQTAVNDSGNTPDIVKIDPKQFLIGQNSAFIDQRKQAEANIIRALQREAEAACPLPQEHVRPIESQPKQQAASEPLRPALPPSDLVDSGIIEKSNALDRIALSLERIANVIDKVDFVAKKRKVKRTSISKKLKINNEPNV